MTLDSILQLSRDEIKMRKCHHCLESRTAPPDFHEPFCSFGGDVSGDGSYAEECEHYKECNCESCETIRGR